MKDRRNSRLIIVTSDRYLLAESFSQLVKWPNETRFPVRERIKAVFAVIGSHSAVSYASERQFLNCCVRSRPKRIIIEYESLVQYGGTLFRNQERQSFHAIHNFQIHYSII